MTGLAETEHIVRGLEAGGVDYVTKPIVIEEMLARIRVHLANARLTQSARAALDVSGRFLLAVNRAGRDRVGDAAGAEAAGGQSRRQRRKTNSMLPEPCCNGSSRCKAAQDRIESSGAGVVSEQRPASAAIYGQARPE